jgi:chitinase
MQGVNMRQVLSIQVLPFRLTTVLCAVILAGTLNSAQAEWPARVFAPYVYLGWGDNFKLTNCDDACGQKFYTLAFIIAQQDGRGLLATYTAKPAWDGRTPMDQDLYQVQINAIRQRGGDVLVSFGGEAGKDLALVESDLEKLQAEYQSVIDQYKFTWLDFDIEGKQLKDDAANRRRNTVLAALQKKNPGLMISFTLPVDPNGISKHSQELLKDAVAKGVKVKSANVMTMYFGPQFTKDKQLCDVCIASAKKAHEQCQKIDPAIQIGLTPMIGKGGDKGSEVFDVKQADALYQWAQDQPWVCSLSFWCSNRDSGKPSNHGGNTASGLVQQPWDFSNAFKPFTTKK